MRTLMLTAGLVASLAMAAGPAGAQPDEHHYRHHHHYYHHGDNCRARTHRRGAIGAVAGAVGGGLIGNSISHGAGGTLLGAGAGALAGSAVARNTTHC